jgi:hypothetical protein
MRLRFVLVVLVALISASAAPVRPRPSKPKPASSVAHGPHRPASRSEAMEQAKSGTKTKGNFKRVMVTRMVHGRMVRVSRVVRMNTGPVVPPHPDADRLREIQKALADKGYFKGETDGVWNADSMAALKQFQTDRNLTADGKISALSLIGLGLGPKHEGSVVSLPAAKPEPNIPQ